MYDKDGNKSNFQIEEADIPKRSMEPYGTDCNFTKDTEKHSTTNGSWYRWLSRIMFSTVAARWIFYYEDAFIVVIAMEIFSTFCIISIAYLVIKKKFKQSISLIIPVVFATLVGFTPFNMIYDVPNWLSREMLAHSRHYVEFLIQKSIYNPEIDGIKNGTEYKRWKIRSNYLVEYSIVFDITDKVIYKDSTRNNNFIFDVYKVGEHYYVVEKISN